MQVVKVPRSQTIWQAIAKLRRQRGVLYAVPDYIAHQAGGWIPNDPGNTHRAKGWQAMQWNFLAGVGVDAPDAWAHMFADHRPGGRGVVIAVLDTGVAYRNWEQFRESPDFGGTHFVDPYDFVAGNPYPLDREGHGTFVAGMIAEATNNRFGLTGLAYGAKIMPIRVLDANGNGDSATIAQGIRYAVKHGAQVINLSLEFDITVTAPEIPDIISAINFAHQHGVVVVAAAGNDSALHLAYPAAAQDVISVGATTSDRCMADYSNSGTKLDLVAPGRRRRCQPDQRPDCHPLRNLPRGAPDDLQRFRLARAGPEPRPVQLPNELRHVDVRARGFGDRRARDRQPRARPASVAERDPRPPGADGEPRSAPASRTRTTATGWSTPAPRPHRCPPQPPRATSRTFYLVGEGGRSRGAVPRLRCADDQHRARRVVRDLVRHRTEQEALGARHPLVADHDQVAALLLGDVDDRVGRVTLAGERLDLGDAAFMARRGRVRAAPALPRAG